MKTGEIPVFYDLLLYNLYSTSPYSYPQTGTVKDEMAWAESDHPAIADSVNWHADVSQ